MGSEEAGCCQSPKCEMGRATTRTVEMTMKERYTEESFDMLFIQDFSVAQAGLRLTL